MPNKMLIDASHPEETRVVVMRGDRVEEFDFESALRKQLRGNIYLAKVTRVEPSLQAAFVDYGGNRHGFLAFNEIHPDYYQLPQADREALLEYEAQEARHAAQREVEADDEAPTDEGPKKSNDELEASGEEDLSLNDNEGDATQIDDDDFGASEEDVESVGSEDALEELPERQPIKRKHYKIQEVIRRRQIILIQVVKEERGNKGAALTTYLSLAGRYTVLMPNTARGGGISRKIANPTDRKRLRKIVAELEVPEGMGLIVRTAGASRTKAELKRDFEYLLRLWENVRDLTLQSSAPSLVYEEGNLIKRSIRDLYNKDIEEVLVSGEEEYREAKDFMRMLMPSHAKNVQPYKYSEPLFARYKIEAQLNAMYSPYVTLPSGGYIVINQTEALVSVDVNSGRATKEHSIEETALKTNLEAASEISRQLRLRDLAGLVVIDFIDMEERRNNRSVERRLKECLRFDRARIQVGRISHFGLLEMSRQRLRTGVLEGSTSQCQHCSGTGMIRSTESMALTILRALEDRLQTQRQALDLVCNTNVEVALYILNNKRNYVHDIEHRYSVNITIQASQNLEGVSYTIENIRRDEQAQGKTDGVIQMDWAHKSTDNERTPLAEEQEEKPRRRRRRRRGGQSARRGKDAQDQTQETNDQQAVSETEADPQTAEQSEQSTTEDGDENKRRPRRRGRRGGRRRGPNRADRNQQEDNGAQEDSGLQKDGGLDEKVALVTEAAVSETDGPASEEGETDKDKRSRYPRRRQQSGSRRRQESSSKEKNGASDQDPSDNSKPDTHAGETQAVSVKETSGGKSEPEKLDPASLVASNQDGDEASASPRRGWWQKRSG